VRLIDRPSYRAVAGACLVVTAVLLIYGWRLAQAPVYLAHDEVLFAVNAQSIAATGRDLNGRFLPLYVQITSNYWAQPMLIYLTALALEVLPFSETVVRGVSVAVASVSIALMFFAARRLLRSGSWALVAAAMLALTPAFFLHSRMAVDPLYIVPFALAWLLWLTRFLDERRPSLLFASTTALGLGVYSYIAALVLMPIYFALTCVIALRRDDGYRTYAVAFAGFVWPMVLLVVWIAAHPSVYAEQVKRYNLYDSARFGPLQGVREIFSYVGLTARSSVYGDYFNPSFLFVAGGSSLVNSTRQAGVFLAPMAVFLPVGIYAVLVPPRARHRVLLVAGLAAAPIAAALVPGAYAVDRVLVMIPFAVLLATIGIRHVWEASARSGKALVLCLLAVMPIQFAGFYRDYLRDYRIRSSTWFERNIRGGVEDLIARASVDAVPAVYLPTSIAWIDAYWRFYLLEHHREDLTARTILFDPARLDAADVPPRSLVLVEVSPAGEPVANPRLSSLRRLTNISEPNGVVSFAVLQR
jgi:4-amino-4-deoxy-L-arabinose transferase-like glycosyltransferase